MAADSNNKKPHPEDADIDFLVRSNNLRGPFPNPADPDLLPPKLLDSKTAVQVDTEILHEARNRLSRDREIDATEIRIDVQEGVLTLTGKIESVELRRKAEDRLQEIPGLLRIRNHLRVAPIGMSPSPIP